MLPVNTLFKTADSAHKIFSFLYSVYIGIMQNKKVKSKQFSAKEKVPLKKEHFPRKHHKIRKDSIY